MIEHMAEPPSQTCAGQVMVPFPPGTVMVTLWEGLRMNSALIVLSTAKGKTEQNADRVPPPERVSHPAHVTVEQLSAEAWTVTPIPSGAPMLDVTGAADVYSLANGHSTLPMPVPVMFRFRL